MTVSTPFEGGAGSPPGSALSIAAPIDRHSAVDVEPASPSPSPSPSSDPIVKWAGSKRALAPRIADRLRQVLAPSSVYHEPFAGSAAVLLRLRSIGVDNPAQLSDVNTDLIDAYRTIAADPVTVMVHLETFKHGHSAGKYACVREAWNGTRDTWSAERRAAAFLYLNKTCFNGLWRVNAAGAFNVPCGDLQRTPAWPTLDQLRAFGATLGATTLEACGFIAAMTRARAGDVIYCDPPYLALSPTSSFAGYGAGGFSIAEHEALAVIAAELVRRGIYVMLSNADVPAAYELYPSDTWRIAIVDAPRKIAANGGRRGIVTELLITPHEVP